MKQHLTDQEIIEQLFELAEGPKAQETAAHLKKCAACRKRTDALRAKLGQIDLAKEEPEVSEELIAATLRGVRGDERKSEAQADVPPMIELPDPGFRHSKVIEWSHVLWLGAMAAAAVVVIVAVPKFFHRETPPAVVMAKPAGAVAAQEKRGTIEAWDTDALREDKEGQAPIQIAKATEAAPARPLPVVNEPVAHEQELALKKMEIASAKTAPPATIAQPAAAEVPATPPPAKLAAADAAMPPMPSAARPSADTLADARRSRAMESVLRAPAPAAVPAPASAPVAFGGAGVALPAEPESATKQVAAIQTVHFFMPMASGTWLLAQNVHVRAWAQDNGVRLQFSNDGVLPLTIELRERGATNVIRSFGLDPGATTNFFEKSKR